MNNVLKCNNKIVNIKRTKNICQSSLKKSHTHTKKYIFIKTGVLSVFGEQL